MDPQSQATALKKNIALADLEYDPVPDELKYKMERSWDRLHDYSLALIDWVETTRSRTLVPLKVHLFDPLDAAERASGDSTDISSLLAHLPEGEGLAKKTLSRAIRYYDSKMRNIKVSRNVAFSHNQEVKEVDIPGLGIEEGLDVPKVSPISPITDQQNNINLASQSSSPAQSPHQMPIDKDTLPIDNDNSLNNLADSLHPQTSKLRNRKITIDYKKYGNPDARKASETALNLRS